MGLKKISFSLENPFQNAFAAFATGSSCANKNKDAFGLLMSNIGSTDIGLLSDSLNRVK